ncbi:MAG: phage holin family protein [Candidatus Obscuribacterales bacterium]|nr:phage holin family protein [Steroidobacteraceae bacterium]
MVQMPFSDHARTVEPLPADSDEINPLNAIRILRSAGQALFTQAALHGQLARVEWAEEKTRLLKMLVAALLGFTFSLCVMLFTGALVLAFTWETAYRVPAAVALVIIYAVGLAIAWYRFQALSARSSRAFAATREELAEDFALLRSKL